MRSSTLTLYIDTSSSCLYTGLVENDELKIKCIEDFGKDLSTHALAKIQDMFTQINKKPQDLERIVVVNGPGSFTGIRIGITIAKTLAWFLEKPITTITSLEAMAISSSNNGYKVPCIDARRGYVFAGIYDENNKNILENQYIQLESLIEMARQLEKEYQIISNDDLKVDKMTYVPDIVKIVESCKTKESINPHAVNPEYLKRTEAEENKGIITE